MRGKIYVFVKNSRDLGKVDFYLDGRWRTKPPVQTDTNPPFDFAGTAADGTALPYETTKLADGSHTIRAVLTWSDGTSSSRRGNFTVANSGPTATTTASPTAPTTTVPADHHCGSDNRDHRNANDNGDRGAFDVNDGASGHERRLPRPP